MLWNGNQDFRWADLGNILIRRNAVFLFDLASLIFFFCCCWWNNIFKCFLFHRYRWDQVGNAVFKRYPNPWSKHILSEDVVSRKVEGPILKSIRIITKQNKVPLPKFVSKVIASFYSRGVFKTLSKIYHVAFFKNS